MTGKDSSLEVYAVIAALLGLLTAAVNLWAALKGARQNASLRAGVSELAASFRASQTQMDVVLGILGETIRDILHFFTTRAGDDNEED